MNPYTQDMSCPGGCGQTITYNKEYDDWTHSGLHDTSCPFHAVEPMRHQAVLGFRWGKWKFNDQGKVERIEQKPEPVPEPKLADVISLAQHRKKKS
jgi:hypothetical protein